MHGANVFTSSGCGHRLRCRSHDVRWIIRGTPNTAGYKNHEVPLVLCRACGGVLVHIHIAERNFSFRAGGNRRLRSGSLLGFRVHHRSAHHVLHHLHQGRMGIDLRLQFFE